ncbi:MAG: potassium-transporting ATPase subunit KdpA, partial [Dehalococcoidia bacterium]
MNAASVVQMVVILGVVLLAAKPLGTYIARVIEGERVFLTPVLGPVEQATYRLAGVSATAEQGWRGYAG